MEAVGQVGGESVRGGGVEVCVYNLVSIGKRSVQCQGSWCKIVYTDLGAALTFG